MESLQGLLDSDTHWGECVDSCKAKQAYGVGFGKLCMGQTCSLREDSLDVEIALRSLGKLSQIQ